MLEDVIIKIMKNTFKRLSKKDTFSKPSRCDYCERHVSGECDKFGLETLCGFAYRPYM